MPSRTKQADMEAVANAKNPSWNFETALNDMIIYKYKNDCIIYWGLKLPAGKYLSNLNIVLKLDQTVTTHRPSREHDLIRNLFPVEKVPAGILKPQ